MSTPLYLTAEERAVFEKLPAKVREGWTVLEETLNAYETEKQLKIRRDIFRKKDPAFEKLAATLEKIQGSPTMEEVAHSVGPVPKMLLLNILFTMGAGYVRDWIRRFLPAATTQQDMASLSELTQIRHLLFEENLAPVS